LPSALAEERAHIYEVFGEVLGHFRNEPLDEVEQMIAGRVEQLAMIGRSSGLRFSISVIDRTPSRIPSPANKTKIRPSPAASTVGSIARGFAKKWAKYEDAWDLLEHGESKATASRRRMPRKSLRRGAGDTLRWLSGAGKSRHPH
jgi:hypothetical protein